MPTMEGVPVSKRERLREIITVLGSYGFGHIYRTRIWSKDEKKDAERLRLAFEALGPTFIKFGQILSTRQDLLPADYIDELSKLRDNAPSFPFSAIQQTFEEDLGRPLMDVFAEVDPEPLASASIAQVHRGRLVSGEEVILKVQRPDMEENLLRDIQLFSRVVEMTPGLIKDLVIDAGEALKEIEHSTRIELDFRNEAAATERFGQNNAARPVVGVPEIYSDLVSKRVLVEEYIDGIHNFNREELVAAGYRLDDLSQKFIYTYLLNIFKDGFFHADPHPGNMIVRGGKICFIDFGLYGELSERHRQDLLELVQAIVLEDLDRLMNKLLQVAIVRQRVDRFQFHEDLKSFFYTYLDVPLAQIYFGDVFTEMLQISQAHGLIMPNDLVMLAKSLAMVEGVATDLDGSVSVLEIAKTFIRKNYRLSQLTEDFSPSRLSVKALQMVTGASDIPQQLSQAFRTYTDGRSKIYVELAEYEEKERSVNKMINRLVFAIIIAAIILASSVIVIFAESTRLQTASVFLFIGAGMMGLWLLYSIIKSDLL